MKRMGYREAIKWLASNDDCYWVDDTEPNISVCASLVADMFGVIDERVAKDLRRELEKSHPAFMQGPRSAEKDQ